MNKSPCTYNCKNRNIYCHSQCERYIKYRKLQDKLNKEREKEIDFTEYSFTSKKRMGVGRII